MKTIHISIFLGLLVTATTAGCGGREIAKADQVAPASYAEEVQDTPASEPPSSAAQMRDQAARFLSMLSAKERATAMFEITDEAARTRWSNLPSAMVERGGIRIGDMTHEQRRQLHDLIRASTSSQGYLKISGIMWLDDILHAEAQDRLGNRGGNGFRRLVESWKSENYWVSVFGDPTMDTRWGWLLTGHHLAASFTVVGSRVAYTPAFLGAEPYEIESGPYAGWRILSHEVERGYELLQALSAEQRKHAVLAVAIPRDVLEGPGRKASLETFQGIPASSLSAGQRALLWHLIEEYVRNADHDTAERHLLEVEHDGVDSLWFAWIGPTDSISKRYYYRVHGPSILIEYVRERGVGGDQGAANHVHSIVRDPGNDYGEDWLETHYREHHR